MSLQATSLGRPRPGRGHLRCSRHRRFQMANTITRDELELAVQAQQVTLVETLRAEHFEQGHIPGAVHIHYEAVIDQALDVLPDKHAAIVTYCSNTACRNSEIAANQLVAM